MIDNTIEVILSVAAKLASDKAIVAAKAAVVYDEAAVAYELYNR